MFVGNSELELFQKEFQVLKALKKGNSNIVKAFNAKFINPFTHFTTVDMIPLLQSPDDPFFISAPPVKVAYIRLEYCSRGDLFSYVKSGTTRF